jgi:hypothetical protein
MTLATATAHISLFEFLPIGGNGRQPHHQSYSLVRKSCPANVIMHKANVCIITVSITRVTYFIPSPVRNRLQSAHLENLLICLVRYVAYLHGVNRMEEKSTPFWTTAFDMFWNFYHGDPVVK